MKDIKTKEVTTKPKTKNPAQNPQGADADGHTEQGKTQTIANARDNDMGEQSHPNMPVGKSHPQRNGLQERQAEL